MGASPLTLYTFPDEGVNGLPKGLNKLFNEGWSEMQAKYKEIDQETKDQYRERFDGLYYNLWENFINDKLLEFEVEVTDLNNLDAFIDALVELKIIVKSDSQPPP